MSRKRTYWENLKKVYERKGIVLVLGAGISIGSGLPTWKELLRNVASHCFGSDGQELFDNLLSHGYSLPAIASAIENVCGERLAFVKQVRTSLYRRFKARTKLDLVSHVQENNSTLRAVAALCAIHTSNNNKYYPNPRLKSVVTFNLDTLLENFTEVRFKTKILRNIENPAISSTPQMISVYHMHGYLPFNKNVTNKEYAVDGLVLTEQDYFEFFNNPTSLFNYTFLHLLHNHSCLFVGLSMLDENIRRLLHYSIQERRIALASVGVSSKSSMIPLRHFAVLGRIENQQTKISVEDLLCRLGVRPLWLNSFEELPDFLGYVYQSNKDDWDNVY